MRIIEIHPLNNYTLQIVAEDGRVGTFDVSPFLQSEAFASLKDQTEFKQLSNGGYFIEWNCGADLSADTIEAQWHVSEQKRA